MLSLNRCESGKLQDSLPVDLASCQAQMSMCLTIIISLMLGYKTFFVYSYDF